MRVSAISASATMLASFVVAGLGCVGGASVCSVMPGIS